MPKESSYEGKVRLHYCTNNECFPQIWFSMSQVPEACPDCKTISQIATPAEEHKHRHNMNSPDDGLATLFLIGKSNPQHEAYGIIKEIEKEVGENL